MGWSCISRSVSPSRDFLMVRANALTMVASGDLPISISVEESIDFFWYHSIQP